VRPPAAGATHGHGSLGTGRPPALGAARLPALGDAATTALRWVKAHGRHTQRQNAEAAGPRPWQAVDMAERLPSLHCSRGSLAAQKRMQQENDDWAKIYQMFIKMVGADRGGLAAQTWPTMLEHTPHSRRQKTGAAGALAERTSSRMACTGEGAMRTRCCRCRASSRTLMSAKCAMPRMTQSAR